MVMPLRPPLGGFLRPFGCGWFIREFLLGNGPYESPPIDPDEGAPQSDIFRAYKLALHREFARDAAIRAEEKASKKEKRLFSPDRVDELTERYLTRIPYKLVCCRYHSFVVYFSNLQRLGWVEPTGKEEMSLFQEHYPEGEPPTPYPRRYFRLTKEGREAGDVLWSNPLFTLYSERWGGTEAAREYLRGLRKRHK